MNNEKLITGLATIISGLAVPYSMNIPIGTARDAWAEVRDELNLFGYPTVEEISERLKEKLNEG